MSPDPCRTAARESPGGPLCSCPGRRGIRQILGRGEDGGGEVGQVHGGAAGGLADLGAAAVAVGDDRRVPVGADGGEQHALTAGLRDLVVAPLEAEVTRQPAAAGIEHLGLDAQRGQHLAVGVEAEVGVLMAVHLDQRLRRRGSLLDRSGVAGLVPFGALA